MLPAKVQIIGEGNVAFHLASGISCIPAVKQIRILSRDKKQATLFTSISDKIECRTILDFDFTFPLSIMAISDDAIERVAKEIKGYKHLLVHTSGSIDSAFFYDLSFTNYGAFYPLQTFSFSKEIVWPEIPIFITASTPKNEQFLIEFSKELSSHVQLINDEQRLSIHIAAVFVNNFSNQLFTLADQWLDKNSLNFDILKPLITETINKLNILDPYHAQTGPAIRRDIKTLAKHKLRLTGEEELQKIYEVMTKSIISSHRNDR